jgi:hypothetical protein
MTSCHMLRLHAGVQSSFNLIPPVQLTYRMIDCLKKLKCLSFKPMFCTFDTINGGLMWLAIVVVAFSFHIPPTYPCKSVYLPLHIITCRHSLQTWKAIVRVRTHLFSRLRDWRVRKPSGTRPWLIGLSRNIRDLIRMRHDSNLSTVGGLTNARPPSAKRRWFFYTGTVLTPASTIVHIRHTYF